MIQQVCTIYCKNWGWPCHINNVSPVGQKTAWRICKYLAFVVAVPLSWPAFTSSPVSVGLNPSAPLPQQQQHSHGEQTKPISYYTGSHYTRVIRKCCVAPSAALFIMFNISRVHHKPGRGRGKKCFWLLLCPDWFSLDPAVGCFGCDAALLCATLCTCELGAPTLNT